MTRRGFAMLAAAAAPQVLDYEVWDVFTDRRLTGNPLAVFFNAEGLGADRMQAIAREMNYSESTFLERRPAGVERERGVRTRIFLRTGEIPFAGHPALGTAFALWERGGRKASRVTLDMQAGAVPVEFGGGRGMMTQPEPVFAETHEAARIAPLIGVAVADIDDALPIQNVSTGRPNLLVMLRSLRALQAAKFDWAAIDGYFSGGDPQRGFYLVTRETRDRARQFHGRKIARGFEDPVTGSAIGAAIAWLVRQGAVKAGERVRFEQGTEIEREGEAVASAERVDGRVTRVQVGGTSVLVMRGQLFL